MVKKIEWCITDFIKRFGNYLVSYCGLANKPSPNLKYHSSPGGIEMPNSESTIQEIYQNIFNTLSPSERLRLAALILNDLTRSQGAVIDTDNTWTSQDVIELTNFSLQYAANLFPDTEET